MTTNTTSTVRKTQRDLFLEVLALDDVQANEELSAFIQSRIDQLDKKSQSKGMTPAQEENMRLKAEIFESMEPGMMYSVADIMKAFPAITSNQKGAALLNQMVDAGQLIKEKDKRKTYFMLAGCAPAVEVEGE